MNIHIYPSVFANESRILKIVRSLRRRDVFSQVRVIAVWKEGLQRREVLGDGLEVVRVPPLIGGTMSGSLGRLLKVVGWYLGVVWSLRKENVACVNCHSLPVLPISALIKLWKRCPLIYDTHELETETIGLHGALQWLARRVESALIRFADAICVVNHSIADWYSNHYKLKQVWVVQNVPHRTNSKPERTGALRAAVGLTPNAQVFLYQGMLSQGRGVKLLIEAFAQLPDKDLVFMGYGELEEEIREAASRFDNIHFMPAVTPDRVKDYTVDADVGLSLIEKTCLSYYLCLPNKVFEYIGVGIPCIVSNFPEMSHLIDEFGCGWKASPNAKELIQLVGTLSKEDITCKAANVNDARMKFAWQNEEKALFDMYKNLNLAPKSVDLD